jgi:DNA helicase-2/ATP-dependent DNA helicase PcrA
VASPLNPKQLEAATAPAGPLLITAGAGSGKTQTLTSRLIYFLEQNIAPEQIIAITFTNKAAEEMRRRVGQKLKSWPFIGTFHSLSARILRAEAGSVGRTPSFVIFDDDDSLKLLKKILSGLEFKKYPPALSQNKISRLKNEVSGPEDEEENFRMVFESYEKALAKQNAFDFDDLIEKTVRLFQNYPLILKKYQDKFRYVLVDEYQDINRAQYLLIKLLAGDHRNLSVVGDDAQSIYGFRGSDSRSFLNFKKDWPEAKIVILDENYRSTANIIAAASAVIKNNSLQQSKNLWTKNEPGSPIKIFAADDPAREAEWLAEKLTRQNLSQTAVLYRTNAQSRPIEQTLIYNGVPYEIFGGFRFYERYEIKDIVAALRFGYNPKDEIAKDRLLSNFNRSASRELVSNLPELASKLSPLELIGFFMKTSGYKSFLYSKYQNAEERLENIEELMGFASEFDNLSDFLEKISLFQAGDSLKRRRNDNAVKLMTIHLAKGLEFENVFLAGATEGILPHQKSLFGKDELEEERRLMYVAMTRAKTNLRISFFDVASRFLYEIPPELIEFEGSRGLKQGDEIYLD